MPLDVQGLLGGLLEGDSFLTQIVVYGLFSQIIGAAATPYLTALTGDVFAKNPTLPLSPADLADMVVRGVMTEGDATPIAARSGVSAADFHNLVLDNGEPPGLESVLMWWRRGFLPWADGGPTVPSVERAIKTSKVKDYWTPVIQQSQWLPLTTADAVNAWVRNQIDEATARKYLTENGLLEPEQTTLYNTTGRPPAPMELATLVRRNIIPLHGLGPTVTSLQQGIVEGDLKDKWEPAFEALIVELPSIFEIRNMQQAGAIDANLAASLYGQHGIQPNLIASLVAAGHSTKVAKVKQLSVSLVEKLYTDKIITREEAAADLAAEGWEPNDAEYMLEVTDLAVEVQALHAAVTNVRSRYLARRITRDEAVKILGELGVSDAGITQLMGVWDLEQQAQVRVLTAAEITDAVYYGVASQDWAMTELQALGYNAVDSWVLISLRMKGPQPNPPPGAPTPAPPPPPPPAVTGG